MTWAISRHSNKKLNIFRANWMPRLSTTSPFNGFLCMVSNWHFPPYVITPKKPISICAKDQVYATKGASVGAVVGDVHSTSFYDINF